METQTAQRSETELALRFYQAHKQKGRNYYRDNKDAIIAANKRKWNLLTDAEKDAKREQHRTYERQRRLIAKQARLQQQQQTDTEVAAAIAAL